MTLLEEYRTLVWLRQACQELQVTQQPTMIFQDNEGSISRAEGGSVKYFVRHKLIVVRHQYISRMEDNHEIVLAEMLTREINAGFVIKPLGPGSSKTP